MFCVFTEVLNLPEIYHVNLIVRINRRISLLPDSLYDLLLKCQRIFFPSASLLFVNLPESLCKLFGLPGNPLFFFLSFCFFLIFLPVSVLSFHGNTAPPPRQTEESILQSSTSSSSKNFSPFPSVTTVKYLPEMQESICFSSLCLNITLVRFQSQEDSNGLTTNISQQPVPLLVLFTYLDYRRVPLPDLLPHPFPDSIRGDPLFSKHCPGPAGTKFLSPDS